jgi:hypothetical protein
VTRRLRAARPRPRAFPDVFRTAARDERIRGHGMSDLQLAAHLNALADGPAPLVTITPDDAVTAHGIRRRHIALTTAA